MRKRQMQEKSRLDRFDQSDLRDLIESQMMRAGELMRGLSHSELDQRWVLAQLDEVVGTEHEAIRALRRKVELLSKI